MIPRPGTPISILIADDDADDRFMIREALNESLLANDIYEVADGEELLHFLQHTGPYANGNGSPRPGLVLLDLNMPKKDGRQALKEIKEDHSLRSLPVIVLTTSRAEEDILRTYDIGVSSFITKPVTFEGLVDIMKTIRRYWFEIVELPPVPMDETYRAI